MGDKGVLRTKGINLVGFTRLTGLGLFTLGARTARVGRGAKFAFGAVGAGVMYFFGVREKNDGTLPTLLTLGTLGTRGTPSRFFLVVEKQEIKMIKIHLSGHHKLFSRISCGNLIK